MGAARKVSPDWSQNTMTRHSFNCFSIVWGQSSTKIKAFSRRSRAATAKKCTKKRDARAKLLFWLLNLLLFDVLVAVAVAVVGS